MVLWIMFGHDSKQAGKRRPENSLSKFAGRKEMVIPANEQLLQIPAEGTEAGDAVVVPAEGREDVVEATTLIEKPPNPGLRIAKVKNSGPQIEKLKNSCLRQIQQIQQIQGKLPNMDVLRSSLATLDVKEGVQEGVSSVTRSSPDYPDKKNLTSVQDFFRYTEAEGKRLFDELDRDNDGQVTLDDLEVAMTKRRLPLRYAKEFMRRTRKRRSAKSIGWSEFHVLMEQQEPQMLRAYTKLSLSPSGTLQKNQVLVSLKNAGLPATDGNAAAMMMFLNVDTEGSIAYGQFRNFMLLLPPERLGDDPLMVWFEAATVVPMAPPVDIPAGSVQSALAGGLVSALSTSMLHPFDTVKALDTTGALQDLADDVYQVEYDGASKSNPGPAGAGALVRRPDGSVVCELREGIGSATNNVAEYRAFILGLKGALDRGIYRVKVQGDSKLVCEQVLGRWKVNQPTLAILCKEAQRLIENFSEFSVQHVDRKFNSAADQLANEAVSLPETKFVSSFPSARAGKAEGALGDLNWRQCRERKTYGAFDFAQSSQLRLTCKSYYLGFRPSPVVGAQWLRNIFSPNKAKRTLALVARPRVSSSSWILTRRCFTNMMAVRLLL